MENIKAQDKNTLPLTSYCFKILINRILDVHSSAYSKNFMLSVSQLYGFGNYDPKMPNLKMELEKLTDGFVNGKYLYDKKRELQAGKSIIKLNRFYKTIVFQFIGYTDIYEFLQREIIDPEENARQLNLISSIDEVQPIYYVSYHFGEYKEIIKAEVTVAHDWKIMEYKYLYPQVDGSFKEFYYFGSVKKRADALHIRTKTLIDGKMVEGGENILYIGYGDPSRCQYMLGVFSAFDINNRVIAGKTIHEKFDTKQEMIQESRNRVIPAYIAQELRNVRIESDAIIPASRLEISQKSPYSITYQKIPGNYTFEFYQDEKPIGEFAFSINKDTYRVTPATSGILVQQDAFALIQNGSVIHFSFQTTGISLFTQLEVFIKTYYLNNSTSEIEGVFSGLDIENRLVNGVVKVKYR